MSEGPAPAKAPTKAPAKAPAKEPANEPEKEVAKDPPPDSTGEAPPAAEGEGEVKKRSRGASLPVLSQDQIAPPPIDANPTKSKKDFFICSGILLLFGIACAAGAFAIYTMNFAPGKERHEYITGTRQKMENDHGVINAE